jgi:hypothetical protein
MKALLVLSLVLTPVPVLAFSSSGERTTTEGQQKERLICRQVRMNSSSSRVRPQRVCATRVQWRQRDDISTDDAEDSLGVQTRAYSNLPTPATPQ